MFHLIFVLEIELNSILHDFFLLFDPKLRIVEIEDTAFRTIGKYESVAVWCERQPLYVDILEIAETHIFSFFIQILDDEVCTLK